MKHNHMFGLALAVFASVVFSGCASSPKTFRGIAIQQARSANDPIKAFRVTIYTTGDNKDEGNGVKISVVRSGTVVAERGFVDHSLTYPKGDVRDWDIPTVTPFVESDASNSTLVVTMSGNDGNWEPKFSVVGIRNDDTGAIFLGQTGQVHFESGENNTHSFGMKSP